MHRMRILERGRRLAAETEEDPAAGHPAAASILVRAAALTALLLLPTPGWGQRGNDQVHLDTGDRLFGSITASSPEQLTLSVEGVARQVLVADIARVVFRDDPPGLQSARVAIEQGQLEQARSRLEDLPLGGVRPIVQQDVEYLRALASARLAMQGTGDVMDAGREVLSFLKRNPQSFRFYPACELMGDLAMTLGRFDSAAEYYVRLEKAQSRELQARGQLLQGQAWLRQGDTARAAALLQQAAGAEDDRVKALAQVGLARCDAHQGRPEDGITKIEQIIAQHDAGDAALTELFARAYNALGYCYQVAGKESDAVLAYLHTDMLFHRALDAHAESLFHLGKLWAEINKPAEAIEARQLLKQRYASTHWAKQDSP